MKRGTRRHWKTKKLMRLLGIPQYGAVGILESLWGYARESCKDGAVGRLTNEEIADEIGWDRAPDELIKALADCGLVDHHDQYRLVIHDWNEHANDIDVREANGRMARGHSANGTGGRRSTRDVSGHTDGGNAVAACAHGRSAQRRSSAHTAVAHERAPPNTRPYGPPYNPPAAAAAEIALSSSSGGSKERAHEILAALIDRGLQPGRAKVLASRFSVDDVTEIIAFFDERLSAKRLANPKGALKSMLETPERWDFEKDEDGRLIRPKDSCKVVRPQTPTEKAKAELLDAFAGKAQDQRLQMIAGKWRDRLCEFSEALSEWIKVKGETA